MTQALLPRLPSQESPRNDTWLRQSPYPDWVCKLHDGSWKGDNRNATKIKLSSTCQTICLQSRNSTVVGNSTILKHYKKDANCVQDLEFKVWSLGRDDGAYTTSAGVLPLRCLPGSHHHGRCAKRRHDPAVRLFVNLRGCSTQLC